MWTGRVRPKVRGVPFFVRFRGFGASGLGATKPPRFVPEVFPMRVAQRASIRKILQSWNLVFWCGFAAKTVLLAFVGLAALF